MYLLWMVILAGVSHASIPKLHFWSDGANKKLKVRVSHNAPNLKVRGFDLKFIDSRGLKIDNGGSAEWVIECKNKTVTAKRSDSHAQLQWTLPLKISSVSGIFHIQNQLFKDTTTLTLSEKGCDLVAEIPFDSLVIAKAAEVDTKLFPTAALDSEIIMQRSLLLHTILKQREKPNSTFDLDAPRLLSLENPSEYKEDYRIQTAVKRTEGQVLTLGPDAAPEIFQAYSHAECAGHTVTPETVWGRTLPGYTRSIACPACLTKAATNWSLDIRERELINLMLAGIDHTGVPSQWPMDWNRWFVKARLTKIEVKKYDNNQRAQIITLSFENNPESKMDFDITGSTFRNWVGISTIKSTNMTIGGTVVHKKNNSFHFEGRGLGHGVGLCQAGAKSLALQGMSSENILKTYFPSAQIRKM